MAKTVVALFDDIRHAHKAVEDLRKSRHFTSEDVTLMAHDADNRYSRHITRKHTEGHEGNKAGSGAAAGAGIGGVVGAIAGFLVGVGVIFVPGLGPIVAAGPLVSTLLGAAGGAAAGGIVGALIGLGIPETEAHAYAEGLRRGGTLVVVRSEDAYADDAVDIMSRHRPVDIDERAQAWRESGWTGEFDTEGPVYDEARIEQERAYFVREPAIEERITAKMYAVGGPSEADATNGRRDVYREFEPEFRHHFESIHGQREKFEDYAEGYRFGTIVGSDDRFSSASWDEIEPSVRQSWSERSRGSWERFKDAVAYAWYKTKSELFDSESPSY